MARRESDVFDGLPHRKIAKLYADGYDMEALTERFHWASLETLYDSVAYGRGMQRREAGLPPLRPPGRKTSIAIEEAVMAAAVAKGTINGAGKDYAVSNDLVRTLFFERGLDYPRRDYGHRSDITRKVREGIRVSKGFPAITADSLRADVEFGLKVDAIAARYGMATATLRQRARTLGVDLKPRADRSAMLRAYESGESVLGIARRMGLSLAYVRDCLSSLGAFQPDRPLPVALPPVKIRGRLSAASLREDLNAGLRVVEIAQRRGVSVSAVRSTMSKQGWKANRVNARAPATGRASS